MLDSMPEPPCSACSVSQPLRLDGRGASFWDAWVASITLSLSDALSSCAGESGATTSRPAGVRNWPVGVRGRLPLGALLLNEMPTGSRLHPLVAAPQGSLNVRARRTGASPLGRLGELPSGGVSSLRAGAVLLGLLPSGGVSHLRVALLLLAPDGRFIHEPIDESPLEWVEDERLDGASEGAPVDRPQAGLEFAGGCEHTMPDGSNVFDETLSWSNDGSNALREAAYMEGQRCDKPALKQVCVTQMHVFAHHA